MASGKFFRTLRIFILLAILIGVGMSAWTTRVRTTSWGQPLWVVVYPVNGDGSEASSKYIDSLEKETFMPVEEFMESEARYYKLKLSNPVTIKLAPRVDNLPPEPPQDGNIFHIMWWSLKLRYWAYRVNTYDGPAGDIRAFVLYYDPATHKELAESLGLQKGLICVAKVFANWKMAEKNNIVIAHELLHTVGATDKYDLTTGQPIFPDGYADPGKNPLYPQEEAEIMACRIPLSKIEAKMPESLYDTIIGQKTAREIKWID
jgi:hypothetical protein